MKKTKRFFNVFILSIILISMSGCNQYQGKYTFWRQDRSNIQKVEVCLYDRDSKERTVITQLSNADAQDILDEISNMECFEWGLGDHPRGYGPIIVCVTYLDGEIEIIGLTNVGYITSEGETHLTRYSIKEKRAFYDLVCKYADSERIPDAEQIFGKSKT